MKKKDIKDIFQELGETLKKNRSLSDFSKEDVYENTHISVETIEEIENGELTNIPTIYLRDFIIRYAGFLGMRNSVIVETFLSVLAQCEQKIPKIKRGDRNRKPVKIILVILIPFLLIMIILQLFGIQRLQNREVVKITNKGNMEAVIQQDDKEIHIQPNETISFKEGFSGKIINTEKSLIVVEYYEDTWEVFFKEFEVQIKNGQDS